MEPGPVIAKSQRQLGMRTGGMSVPTPPPSRTAELRQQTLNFQLEVAQMAQTDAMRDGANSFAVFVWFAPGTNGDC